MKTSKKKIKRGERQKRERQKSIEDKKTKVKIWGKNKCKDEKKQKE